MHFIVGNDISLVVFFDFRRYKARFGFRAERDEYAVGFNRFHAPVLKFHVDGFKFFVAVKRVNYAVQHKLDFFVVFCPFHQDFFGAETFAPVHDINLVRNRRKIQRVLESGVAAARDDDGFPLKEIPVANRAVRHAAPDKIFFVFDAGFSVVSADRQNQTFVFHVAAFKCRLVFFRENARNLVKDKLRAVLFGLRKRFNHKVAARNPVGAHIVFKVVCKICLAARRRLFDNADFCARARRIYTRRQPRRTRSYYQYVVFFHTASVFIISQPAAAVQV